MTNLVVNGGLDQHKACKVIPRIYGVNPFTYNKDININCLVRGSTSVKSGSM